MLKKLLCRVFGHYWVRLLSPYTVYTSFDECQRCGKTVYFYELITYNRPLWDETENREPLTSIAAQPARSGRVRSV